MANPSIAQSNVIRFPIERCRTATQASPPLDSEPLERIARRDIALEALLPESSLMKARALVAPPEDPLTTIQRKCDEITRRIDARLSPEDPLIAIQLSARAQAERIRAQLAAYGSAPQPHPGAPPSPESPDPLTRFSVADVLPESSLTKARTL